MRWPIHLMKEYVGAKMWGELEELSLQTLEMMEGYDEAYANQVRGSFYSAILCAEYENKRYERVHKFFLQFIEDAKLNEIGKCSVYLYEIEALYDSVGQAGDTHLWSELAKYSEQYILNWKEQDSKQLDEQSQSIQDSLVLVNYAVKQECYSRVRNVWLLAQSYIKDRSSKADTFAMEAQNDLWQWMQGKAEFLTFDETYWKLAQENLLPLEDILLSLPLSQWMALVYALQTRGKVADWEKVCSHMKEIHTKDNIRYSYFFMNYYNYILEQDIELESVTQMEALITEQCDWNLKYAGEVYTDLAFEEGMEMLPDSCRAAVYLNHAVHCSRDEWSRKLDLLGLAVKAQSGLADTVKSYAKLLGQEQEQQETAAKQADAELHKMAEEVLKQVAILMQNEMYGEALGIVRQLKQMLPDNDEIISLEEELEKAGK